MFWNSCKKEFGNKSNSINMANSDFSFCGQMFTNEMPFFFLWKRLDLAVVLCLTLVLIRISAVFHIKRIWNVFLALKESLKGTQKWSLYAMTWIWILKITCAITTRKLKKKKKDLHHNAQRPTTEIATLYVNRFKMDESIQFHSLTSQWFQTVGTEANLGLTFSISKTGRPWRLQMNESPTAEILFHEIVKQTPKQDEEKYHTSSLQFFQPAHVHICDKNNPISPNPSSRSTNNPWFFWLPGGGLTKQAITLNTQSCFAQFHPLEVLIQVTKLSPVQRKPNFDFLSESSFLIVCNKAP